jgi:hypothetical protein
MFPVNAGQPKQIVALLNMILTSERDDMHEHINRSIDFPSKKKIYILGTCLQKGGFGQVKIH